MTYFRGLYIEEVPWWCACDKVCHVNKVTVKHVGEALYKEVAKNGASCVMISVNCDEKEVIEHLKKEGFKRTPIMRNWGHGGRKTYCYLKQFTKKFWLDNGGDNNF